MKLDRWGFGGRLPKGFCLALAASLLVHVLLLAAPALDFGAMQSVVPHRLDARLQAAPVPPAAVAAEPMRQALDAARATSGDAAAAQALPMPRSALPAPGPAVANDAIQGGEAPVGFAEDPPAPEPALELPPEPTPLEPIVYLTAAGQPAGTLWPARGEIVFDVFRGDGSFRLGTTTHRWQHDGGRYAMEARVETTGLVALFKTVDYVQRSEGRLLPQGLQPETFSVERGGKRREWSEFDWKAGRVRLFKDGKAREASLSRGDQDVLSLWHQLSLIEGWSGSIALTVVTGKSAAGTRVEELGSEQIEVPAGRFEARHLKATAADGSLVLDIWYAFERRKVPVRIRMQDSKGEVLDQRARSIVIDGAETGSRG